MPPAERALPLRRAVALGLLQGPTELLPVSSSGHTTLLPWLAGWEYAELDGELRKSFELSLHAGATLALLAADRGRLLRRVLAGGPRAICALALSLAPAALAGLVLRGPIERRLGGPGSIALGLAGGGLAMAAADRSAGERRCADARPGDGLALGVAQALALMPGVSRSGATLTAARARGFGREASHSLSWAAALPVLAGASAIELARLARSGAPGGSGAALAAGAGAAFASTLAGGRLLGGGCVARGPLAPYSAYRLVLSGLAWRRLRESRGPR
jgi:undecaprenyl-diphosphatase